MSAGPLVSVVVPTRNSAATVAACLRSIVEQSYPAIEIIVVDNNSTDGTAALARAVTPLVYNAGPERSAQRNAGAQAASGRYVVFIDSDMVLSRDVIACCVEAMTSDPSVKGIYIPERSVGEGFWALCKALERSFYVGDDSVEAARFFDRAAFQAAGGYDETLTGPEDWDCSQRVAAAGRLCHVDSYITHLEGRLTLPETMRSKFYYGQSMGRYIGKRHAATPRQIVFLRPAFLRQWRRLLAQPRLTAGMVLMRACEFAAGAAGLAYAVSRPLPRRFRRESLDGAA